jgi:hypothetical protein
MQVTVTIENTEKAYLLADCLNKIDNTKFHYDTMQFMNNEFILKCENCGRRSVEVHHQDANRSNNNKDNLMFLCNECHILFHCESKLKKHRQRYGFSGSDLQLSGILNIRKDFNLKKKIELIKEGVNNGSNQ